MNLKNAVILIVLCGLLAAGEIIVDNYTRAHVAAAMHAEPPSPPFLLYSTRLRRQFVSAKCPQYSEESYEYKILIEHANEKHDKREIRAIQMAHARHVGILIKRYVADYQASIPSITKPIKSQKDIFQ